MKLGDGTPEGKKQQITAIVAIVVILLAVGLLARNLTGGSGGGSTVPTSGDTMGAPPGEELVGGQTSGPPLGAPPGAPPGEAVPPSPTGAAPGAAERPAAAGDQSPDAAPAAPPMAPKKASPGPAPAKQPSSASSPVPAAAMRQMTVFGSVNVSYPAKWKIDAGAANTSAVFTDGNARFAVHSPDPKADSGKRIAQLAMQRITPGAAVVNEGMDKVSGHDAYWYAIKYLCKNARVVGIDGPTRIAVVETVKSGDFAKYREMFNKMQSGITFSVR